MKFPKWTQLSKGTRRVMEGVRCIEVGLRWSDPEVEGIVSNAKAIAERVRQGHRYPELIAVSGDNDDLIIVEGHKRVTAYALSRRPDPVQMIVGTSEFMGVWGFFELRLRENR